MSVPLALPLVYRFATVELRLQFVYQALIYYVPKVGRIGILKGFFLSQVVHSAIHHYEFTFDSNLVSTVSAKDKGFLIVP